MENRSQPKHDEKLKVTDKEAQEHLQKISRDLRRKNNVIWFLVMLLIICVGVIALKFLNYL